MLARLRKRTKDLAFGGLKLRAPIVVGTLFGVLLVVLATPFLIVAPASRPVLSASIILGGLLSALAAMDLRSFRLPDRLTLALLLTGLIYVGITDTTQVWWRALSAFVAFGGLVSLAKIYEHVRGFPGLGGGDAKLMGAAAVWVGMENLTLLVFIAASIALATLAVSAAYGTKITARTRIPFGPFLGVGTWSVWLLKLL